MAISVLETDQIKLKDIILQDSPQEDFLHWLEKSSPDGLRLRIAYEFARVLGVGVPSIKPLLAVAQRRKLVFDAEMALKQVQVPEPEEREF